MGRNPSLRGGLTMLQVPTLDKKPNEKRWIPSVYSRHCLPKHSSDVQINDRAIEPRRPIGAARLNGYSLEPRGQQD